jgi:hypothetical protein
MRMRNRNREEVNEMASVAPIVETRRLNINLSEALFDELQALARQTRRSMTELIRLAIGLVKIAIQESGRGNKLVVTSPDGTVLKQLVLPD